MTESDYNDHAIPVRYTTARARDLWLPNPRPGFVVYIIADHCHTVWTGTGWTNTERKAA